MAVVSNRPFKLTYPDPTEDQFQASVANLLAMILPEDRVAWTHIAHGGYELTPAARARLYRLGLKRGFPDIVICYAPGRTLWFECKTATGRLSLDQRQKHAVLQACGHVVVVVRRIEEVMAALALHGVPFRRSRIVESYVYGTCVESEASGEPAEPPQGTGSTASSVAA